MKRDGLPREVRDSLWLQLRRDGLAVSDLARRFSVSARTVHLAITRAKDREATAPDRDRFPRRLPPLVPLFPIAPFTPHAACPHHGPLRPGTPFCCMVCSRSGMDAHPELFRDPRTEPQPERRPEPTAEPTRRETRRQRRARARDHSPASGGGPSVVGSGRLGRSADNEGV